MRELPVDLMASSGRRSVIARVVGPCPGTIGPMGPSALAAGALLWVNMREPQLPEAAMFQREVHRSQNAAPDRRRPPWRLLVESPDPGLAISNFDAFRDAGFEVTVCAGPAVDAGEGPGGR